MPSSDAPVVTAGDLLTLVELQHLRRISPLRSACLLVHAWGTIAGAMVLGVAGLALFLKIRHWTDAFGDDKEANLARLAREVQTAAGVAVDPTEVVVEAEARDAAARAGSAAQPETPASAPPAPCGSRCVPAARARRGTRCRSAAARLRHAPPGVP